MSEKVSSASQKFTKSYIKTPGNIKKETTEVMKIDVRIMWVSNYKRFNLDAHNWTPTLSRADYMTNRRAEKQSGSRILS